MLALARKKALNLLDTGTISSRRRGWPERHLEKKIHIRRQDIHVNLYRARLLYITKGNKCLPATILVDGNITQNHHGYDALANLFLTHFLLTQQ